jgi:hypothetical protein
MHGLYILEGVIVLHETIHEIHRKKLDDVPFKIDFKRHMTTLNDLFLQQVLCMKCFVPKWCEWIKYFVQGGSVGIRVHDDVGNNFQTRKGLRQGDPCHLFSSILWRTYWLFLLLGQGGWPIWESRTSFGRGRCFHLAIFGR